MRKEPITRKIRKRISNIQQRDGLVRNLVGDALGFVGRNSGGPSGGRIAMLHIGRCGSTVLGNMLDEETDLLWDSEALHPRVARARDLPAVRARERFDEHTFNREIRRRFIHAGKRRYGFELKTEHLELYGLTDPKEARAVLEGLGFGVFISLGRTNVVRQLVSSIRGRQVGNFHINATDRKGLKMVPVDCDLAGFRLDKVDPVMSLEEQLATRQEWMEWNREVVGEDGLHLDFEKHVMQDPSVGYRMICEHIGIKPQELEPSLRRTNPESVDHLLADPKAWRDRLKGTRFEWMMDAD